MKLFWLYLDLWYQILTRWLCNILKDWWWILGWNYEHIIFSKIMYLSRIQIILIKKSNLYSVLTKKRRIPLPWCTRIWVEAALVWAPLYWPCRTEQGSTWPQTGTCCWSSPCMGSPRWLWSPLLRTPPTAQGQLTGWLWRASQWCTVRSRAYTCAQIPWNDS